MQHVTIVVNGQEVAADIDARTLLLEFGEVPADRPRAHPERVDEVVDAHAAVLGEQGADALETVGDQHVYPQSDVWEGSRHAAGGFPHGVKLDRAARLHSTVHISAPICSWK